MEQSNVSRYRHTLSVSCIMTRVVQLYNMSSLLIVFSSLLSCVGKDEGEKKSQNLKQVDYLCWNITFLKNSKE